MKGLRQSSIVRPFRRWVCAIAFVAVLGCFPHVPGADAQTCSNELRRTEQGSTHLADCRAYELVTPVEKDSGEPKAVEVGLKEVGLEGIEGAQAAVNGERMAWNSEYALPGSQAPGLDYLSTRGDEGWSSENVIPPQSVENGLLCPDLVGMVGWSSDLSKGVLADGYAQESTNSSYLGEGFECGHDQPRLVAGEPEGFQNLFVRDSGTHGYQLVNVTPSGVAPPPPPEHENVQYFPASFLAASSDLSHVVFEEELNLTPEAPRGDDVYDWSAGSVRLVTLLPDGRPVTGTLAGATKNTVIDHATETFIPNNVANFKHAVSTDGARIFFQADGNLYVRENGTRTVQIDASQGTGPGGGGRFMAASENGSRVFFLDDAAAGLTTNTTPGSGANLYEADLESGTLTDLTPGSSARVLGVSGAGEDGSYVYFVAEGALEGTHGAIGGEPNLYLFHAGAVMFIATLNVGSDSCDWTSDTFCPPESHSGGLTARVSANGAFIGFTSAKSLTGYDNIDVHSGQPDAEVFIYDALANTLSCASCDPRGAPPTAPGIIRYPAPPDTNNEQRNTYPQRNVSNNGQVFFETADELLPAATNGKRNVYEFEYGRLYLISSGTSEADSYFVDASVSGNDLFFATAEPLLPRDIDSAYDIYDARIEGGFPEPVFASPPCHGEGCRVAAEGPPAFPPPASAGLSGSGNVPASTEPTLRSMLSRSRPLTRRQKLANALKTCRKRPTRKRRACERGVRRRYGSVELKARR